MIAVGRMTRAYTPDARACSTAPLTHSDSAPRRSCVSHVDIGREGGW